MNLAILVALFLLGLVVGGQINHGIYRLAWDSQPKSPWIAPHSDVPPRRWFDRIPVIGWLTLSRESSIHGSQFWLRPLLIELCCGFGFAGWAAFEMKGGLLPPAVPLPATSHLVVTLIPHLVLISLMAVATFIDLDEQTIPDGITIPGTLFALIWLTVFPQAALPQVVVEGAVMVAPIDMASPLEWPEWLDTWRGLLAVGGVFVVWCMALMPLLNTDRYGLGKRIQYWWASLIRPRRQARRGQPRVSRSYSLRMNVHGVNRRLWGLAAAGLVSLVVCWFQLPPAHWRALTSAMMGLGFAGALVWGIRLVGAWAMQQEAMGFGDVTLHAMIGAFLGWQASLLILFLAPFAALGIGLAQLIIEKETRIAFGPYLCLAALVLIAKWDYIWRAHGLRAFQLGSFIPIMVICGLVVMGAMLFVWGKIKSALLADEK